MPVSPGTRLGSYDIVAPLGAGGMGEVYRARDIKLGREVALKILPEAFASDPDRLMRFEREARTLASLNHPNIAQVYGFVEGEASASPGGPAASGGTQALVMELVAGEDLSARIARGPIPLDEALPIARQIAEALEAAHEAGIIHRDLKPANIKVREDGTVKVLDFGLAKALDSTPDALGDGATITSPALTVRGVILGTAAYMAPEQAKGKPVDRRADIWAFGCVLYEMLTGTRAFKGDDITDTLTAVLRDEPDWNALPAETPAHVSTLVRRCLVKDARDRLRDIGEARLALGGGWAQIASTPAAAAGPAAGSSRRWVWAAVLAALVAGSTMGAAWMTSGRTVAAAPPVYALSMLIPEEVTRAPDSRMALSPDGTRLAYVVADRDGSPRLWVRSLSGGSGQPLSGTEDAIAPFWSPDGRSIAFFSGARLRRVDIAGGPPSTICDLPQGPAVQLSGAWNGGGVIIFGGRGPVYRVPASGGTPAALTSLDDTAGETAHRHPFFLPGGQRFLFSSYKGLTPLATFVGSLDAGPPRKVMDGGPNVKYAGGALLYMRDTTLLSQPFDLDALSTTGSAVPVAESVLANALAGGGAFTVSQTGVLIFQAEQRLGGAPLVWSTREGRQTPIASGPAIYRDVTLSPDGTRVALTPLEGLASDVWVLDLARQVRTRLTFDGTATNAVWSPDGRSVLYNVVREGTPQIFRKSADGSGDEVAVYADDRPKRPLSWSSPGLLLFDRIDARQSSDIWSVRLDAPASAKALVAGPTDESWGQLSPDGRWLAYTSDESGRREVYVRRVDGTGSRAQVSSAGGTYPRWRRDGRELFFVSPTNRMVATPITLADDGATLGSPVDLFRARPFQGFDRIFYDVAPDGRFLLAAVPEKAAATELTVLINWPRLLSATGGATP